MDLGERGSPPGSTIISKIRSCSELDVNGDIRYKFIFFLFILEGIRVDDENLALDVIAEVGPGQDFLMHEHTFERMRSQSKTEIFDRKSRDAWIEATDGKTTAEVATEKAMEIINNHQPSPLPPGAEETMDEMVKEFEAKLRADHNH